MNSLLLVANWMSLLWFALLVAIYGLSIGRCISLAKKFYYSVVGIASIGAAFVIWKEWSWEGIGFALAIWIGTLLVTSIAARLWLLHLLNCHPEAADIFMRDP